MTSKLETLSLKGVSFSTNTGTSLEDKYFPKENYTHAELSQYLADFWVPLLKCHSCGRFSYCKYAQPLDSNPKRAKEIQCGVVKDVLDNFLLISWPHVTKYDLEQLQLFFNGLYYFVKFIYEAERTIGSFLDIDYLNWAGNDLASNTFGYISHLRTYLDNFAKEFKKLDEFSTVGKWVVVEGESEKAFIERLGELGFFTSRVSRVEHYGGKGNAKPSKLKLYVESLQDRGYSVILQGDTDGGKRNPLASIVNAGLLDEKLTFPFTKDFEGAFPTKVLYHALINAGYTISENWLIEKMSNPYSGSLIRIIESKIGNPVNKTKLAYELAEIIAPNWGILINKYPENEIIKWLQFIYMGKSS